MPGVFDPAAADRASETEWWRTVHSDAVEPYLIVAADPERTEPADATGRTLRITLRVSAKAPVARVFVRAIIDGIDHHVPADRVTIGSAFARYRAEVTLTAAATHYHFLLVTSDSQTLYYNRRGVHTIYPNEDHDFTVDLRHRVPQWVRSSVFYQIFPDRFCRADRSLGVRTGEITRGPFASREMAWTDAPLAYPQGGSLDFFNGDLPGIASKLDYLQELGVNALYLTPIFTAKTNHRYDCIDYFSVDPHLGGDAALAALCEEVHRRGMRIMLDVSINHIAVEHRWAQSSETGDDVIARNPDGSPVNWAGVPELLKLDYSVEWLRDRVYRDDDSVVAKYLQPPFSIDGWRFDVASEVGNHGPLQQGHDVWRDIRTVIRRINPDAYIVGEHWHDSIDYLCGAEWDSAMNYFASARPLRMWCGERDRFADIPVREAVGGRCPSGFELASLLSQHFDRIPNAARDAQFNLFDSHDVTRLHSHDTFDIDLYAGVVMLLFMLPGTCSIYYGDEIGLQGTTDGDHGKRFPMEWNPDRQDVRLRAIYQKMIALKRGEDALQRGSARTIDAGTEHLVYARFTDDTGFVLLLNRAERDRSVDVDLSLIAPVSCTDEFDGTAFDTTLPVISVPLPARTSRLLRCRPAPR
ncbi:MAG: hypothetical protein EA382_10405 [Spirochaetaceae bacterium]|nr:MAG: hypothetical protein EA382_10405 [Spirochaetaceae bacterium]